MDLRRLLDPRSSFAAKVGLALLGTVGFFMVLMLVVVRAETEGQIEMVATRAVVRAQEVFQESEQRRREQLAQRARVFTDSRRTMALLEAAIEAGDLDYLVGDLGYNLDLTTRLDASSLTVLTDAEGDPLMTLMGNRPVEGHDPAGVRPLTTELLAGGAPELIAYRLVNGRLYTVRVVALELAGRLIGTAAFGLPIRDEDAAALTRVVGAEACFVAGGECVAGSTMRGGELELALAERAGARGRTMAEHAGDRWEIVAEPLAAESPGQGWLVMAIPLEPVLAPFDRIRRALALGSLGALVLALLLGLVLSRTLTRPVRTLVEATRRVGRGEYDTRVPVSSRDELGQLASSFNAMTEGLALKEQYRGVLDKVVSRDVAEELLRGEIRLGGENREVTVLFADIRGFTILTEGMEAQEVIRLLNEIMERLGNAVEDAGGVVDKFVGDEIMAVFGAPIAQTDHVQRAVGAALAMRGAMEEVNARRQARSEPPVSLGTGLHCGEVVAGNMGSMTRLNYTVLGESVNLAARLCSIAAGGEILASGAVADRLPDEAEARPSGTRELKGFSRSIQVFEILRRARSATTGERASRSSEWLLALGLLGGAVGVSTAVPASAQGLPTLQEMGLEWISPGGAVQLGLSGRMDLEGYLPDEEPAWIIPTTTPFVAGRARLFADLFVGSRLFLSTELRVDRSEEPRPGPWEARFDQAYARFGPVAGLYLQAGKFVSPFGGYPQRHHTPADPLIRPPLMYEYRTLVSASLIPGGAAGFLAWKDDPAVFRPAGAPPIWGAPYQWGIQATGSVNGVDYRAGVLNSAPSSEPEEWGLGANPFDRPSYMAGVGYWLAPWIRADVHHSRGPYLEDRPVGPWPTGAQLADYQQVLWWGGLSLELGRTVLRAEGLHDRWEVPNVADDPVDLSYSVEARHRFGAGPFVAARFGSVLFNRIDVSGQSRYSGGGSTADLAKWDYDAHRLQIGAGYRLLRNAEVRAEYAFNRSERPDAAHADLLSVQAFWVY